jgi:hypothetical protein
MNNDDKDKDRIIALGKELNNHLNGAIKIFFEKFPDESAEDEAKILFMSISIFLSSLSFCITDQKDHGTRKDFISAIYKNSVDILEYNNKEKEGLN